ncbi:hypothetical protein ACFWR6_07070 [Streptomyces griseus]|uniref:hypothetical protein n=1 Tax=Streptomyces griseus TaxID=1911 RepID=UPI00365B3C5B
MTLSLTIHCERTGPDSTCARFLPTGTADEATAYAVAAREGWDVGGGDRPDYCPTHAPWRPFTGSPARIHHTRTDPT